MYRVKAVKKITSTIFCALFFSDCKVMTKIFEFKKYVNFVRIQKFQEKTTTLTCRND